MIEEIWKDIKDYEGLYMVSNLGRVKRNSKILKGWIHPKTHYHVTDLWKDNKGKHFKTHRLVAQAFIPNEDNKPFIDHINRNRTDNRVDNLRWVTKTENMNNPLTLIAISKAQKKRFLKAFKDIRDSM